MSPRADVMETRRGRPAAVCSKPYCGATARHERGPRTLADVEPGAARCESMAIVAMFVMRWDFVKIASVRGHMTCLTNPYLSQRELEL